MPSNNFPKIPRRSKHKRTSSKGYQRPKGESSSVPPKPTNAIAPETPRNQHETNTAFVHNRPDIIKIPTTATTKNTRLDNKIVAQENKLCNPNPLIVVSKPKTDNRFNQKEKLLDLDTFLSDKCKGDLDNLKIPDIVHLNPCYYIEILDILKQKAIHMENEIAKTAKIDCPVEARKHVQNLETSLIKVMPLMNLLTSLLRFNIMFDDYIKSNPSSAEIEVLQQKNNIEVSIICTQ